MNRLVSVIASVTALDLKATTRQASRAAIVLGAVGLLFLTCWILAVAGIVLALARGIGVVPAVFTLVCILLITSLGLLVWHRWRVGIERKERRARVQTQRLAIASALAVLPRNRASRTVIIMAALAALAFVVRKPGPDADEGTEG